MQMVSGGSSIFDQMIEILDSFTPTENIGTHKFMCEVIEGAYFILANPPMNIANSQNTSGDQALSMTYFAVYGINNKIARNAASTNVKKTVSNDMHYDYWSASVTIESDGFTIMPGNSAVRKYFAAGVTYYLLKVKGA